MTAEVWVVREPVGRKDQPPVLVAFESKQEAEAFKADMPLATIGKAPLIPAGAEQPYWEWWTKVRLKVWGREVMSPNPTITRVRGSLRLGSRWLREGYLARYVIDDDNPSINLLPVTVEALDSDETRAIEAAQRQAQGIIDRARAAAEATQ